MWILSHKSLTFVLTRSLNKLKIDLKNQQLFLLASLMIYVNQKMLNINRIWLIQRAEWKNGHPFETFFLTNLAYKHIMSWLKLTIIIDQSTSNKIDFLFLKRCERNYRKCLSSVDALILEIRTLWIKKYVRWKNMNELKNCSNTINTKDQINFIQ